MKQVGDKKYFNKQEICDYLEWGMYNLNARIRQSGIDGYRIGRMKYYDEKQIQQLIEYKPTPKR